MLARTVPVPSHASTIPAIFIYTRPAHQQPLLVTCCHSYKAPITREMATKTDMERVGLFKEQGYTTIGDPYVPPNRKPFNVNAGKGRQMLIGGTKSRCGLQTGYFNEKFNR